MYFPTVDVKSFSAGFVSGIVSAVLLFKIACPLARKRCPKVKEE